MGKSYIKRTTALLLAVVMACALMSCTPPNESAKGGDSVNSADTVLSSDAVLRIVVGSHASWPFNADWIALKYFRERVGGDIEFVSIPNTEINTKVSLMMASPNELPDMIHMIYKGDIEPYAMSGALVAIDDYIDLMPNYTKFWNSVPEEQREQYLLQRKSADGKTYYPQVYGSDIITNLRTWMYRKDIFEKHNLKTPETLDELYDVALKLKELYPESYPVSMRSGLNNIGVIGPHWKPFFTYSSYYDYINEKWSFGATEPTMLEIVKYMKKLFDAKLLPPDYLTINAKTWEELISTDRGFMMPEYIVRIDHFNVPNRQVNPDFTLAAMKTPRADTATGQNKIAKLNMTPSGYVICNTGKQESIENSIKLLDWMYSDEAMDFLSWGKEGETYEVIDDKRQFIVDEGESSTSKYGLRSYGLIVRADPKAVTAAYTEEQMGYINFINENMEDKVNPILWLSLNDEEAKIVQDAGVSLVSYAEEMLSKFLLGQIPLTEWDAFQKELNESGVNEVLEVYTNAYNRVTK